MFQFVMMGRGIFANATVLCGAGFLLASISAEAAPPLKLGDADVVPYQHWEIWSSFEYKRTLSEHQWHTPTLEVVHGLLPRTELALETAYDHDVSRDDEGSDSGLGYFSLQPKVRIFDETDRLPAIAAFCKIEVPLDDDGFDWSGREWALALAAEKHFGKHLLVAHARCFLDADGDPFKWRYGANWSHACGDRLKLLTELYAENHLDSSSDELNFRLGCKYRVTDNCKVYAAAGRSLLTARDNRPSFECVTGLMFEF